VTDRGKNNQHEDSHLAEIELACGLADNEKRGENSQVFAQLYQEQPENDA
jgi:hypothetical protein